MSDLPNVRRIGRALATRNLAPGRKVYGEKLVQAGGAEWRVWSPWRSKLGALLTIGTNAFRLRGDETVLYLGAASGTTVSHLSDTVRDGAIVAVEKSARSFRDLIAVAAVRENLLPLLSDASRPESYAPLLPAGCDLLYQDVAQRDQVEIFLKNASRHLRPGGLGLFMVKARSINVAEDPRSVFDRVERRLRESGLKVWERRDLSPFERDHAALVVHRPPEGTA